MSGGGLFVNELTFVLYLDCEVVPDWQHKNLVHLNNNHPFYSHIFRAGAGKKDSHPSFAVEGIGFIFTLFLLAVKRKIIYSHTAGRKE
jgi:hypothetical protein